jgi:hypothetical protein
MKLFTKTLLVSALALAATGAQASIQSIGANTADGSEFVLNLVNLTKQNSYTLDMGFTVAQFMANPNQTLSFNSVLAADANFASFVATYAAGDDASWGIFGGNGHVETGADLATFGFYNTSVANPAGAFNPTFSDLSGNQFARFDSMLGQVNSGTAAVSSNGSIFKTVGQTGYTAYLGQSLFGSTSTVAQGAVGSDLFFAFDKIIDNENYNDGERVVFDGKWNLSIAGGVGSLNYTVSSVPVPAAVWMFGAGLMGMLRLNRRKSIAA